MELSPAIPKPLRPGPLACRALLLALLAGCQTPAATGAPEAPRTFADAQPLTFGVVPARTQKERVDELTPVAEHLEKELGRKVKLEVAGSYKEMARGIAEQRWDVVYLGPILYSRAHETGYDALAVPVRGGTTVVLGQLIARVDRKLGSLQDLRGKRIAFVDENSSAGFQYPFALLFANGLKPTDYTRVFLGSHPAVVQAVFAGEVDAGATYEGALVDDLSPEQRAQVKVLGTTDPIPSDVFAARRSLPELEAVRRALLSVSDGAVKGMRAQKLGPADEKSYDSARKIDLLVSEESGL